MHKDEKYVVARSGIEPLTPRSSGGCSTRLSYLAVLEPLAGIAPTSVVYKTTALLIELKGQIFVVRFLN